MRVFFDDDDDDDDDDDVAQCQGYLANFLINYGIAESDMAACLE